MQMACAGAEGLVARLDRHSLLRVAEFLDDPRDLAALACTCRELYDTGLDNALWERLLGEHFGVPLRVSGRQRGGRCVGVRVAAWHHLARLAAPAAEAHVAEHEEQPFRLPTAPKGPPPQQQLVWFRTR